MGIKRKKGMKFRKRLSAAILVAVMLLSSVQIPGETAYAVELPGDDITSGQEAPIPPAEETEEDAELAEGESRQDEEDVTAGDGSQSGGGSQTEDGNTADGDNQPGDNDPSGDDSQPNDEDVSEEETDVGQVSGDDEEEPVLSGDTEDTGTEEAKGLESEVEGVADLEISTQAEGQNAENPDYTFTTLDGKSVSSRADGKPKVLFFFNSDDYYSQQTSKTLSAHIKNFNGVDIYAIEIKFHTANEVYDFKNTYGCDEITYCYDAQSPDTYNNCYKYVNMLNISSGISRTPIIVFIDSENRVQHGTGGGRKWSEVLTDLREYCVNDYEDMGEERLNVDLVKRSFTTLDDTYVNCRTDGRPKLLVFVDVNNSDEDAGSTVQGISQSISNFAGVDIYVIDAFLNSKADVSKFRDDYGCDEITFAYDEGNYTQSNLKYFLESAGMALDDLKRPVILYVDDDSTMRWVSQGNISAEDIYKNLQIYCDFSLDLEKVYKIKYVLDGGTNSENNPDTYMVGTETIVLEDASKAHFKFEGWYKDAEFEERVTQIRKGSTGNVTLYAKWTRLEDKLDLPNFDQTYSGIDGKKLSSKADGKPKLLVFFMWDQDAGKETMQDITGIIDSLSGVDVYAIDMTQSSSVSDLAKNTKEYKKAYGCDEIKFAYADWNKPANYDKGDAYQQAAGLSGMYLPLMCYIDKDNRLQWVSDHEQTGRQILANLEKYCDYHTENPPEEQGTYKITYVLDGGVNNEDNPDTYTAETETIVLKNPSKTNCVFEGWYEDARYNKRVTEITKGSEGNITLYAKWSKTGLDAANRNYTFTTLDDQTVSSNADGKPKVLFFFKTDCLNCQQTNQGLSNNIEAFGGVDIYAIEINNKAKEDVAKFKNTYGCDEITYCYDKDRTYNACLWDYVRNIIHVDNGSSVTTPVIVFIDSKNRVQYGTAGLRSWTDILTDLQEYCGYAYGNMEGIYKISYALDGGTNDEYNPGTYTADTQTIWLRDAAKEGYMFDGWYTDAGFKNKVTYILKGTTGDITLYAKWKKSAENPEYTFTTIDDETVSSRAEGKPKVLFFFKTGCQYCRNTFWLLSRRIKVFCGADIYAVEISERTKEEVVKFKEDFGCDGITYCYDKDGTYNTCFWDYVRDVTHIASGTVETPVLVFIDSENQVQYATSGERSGNDILTDLQEHCGYDYYWIDYYLAYDEDNSENPEFYKSSGDTITLKDPVREGYKFRGWYKDLEYTQKVTQIPTGTTGDIKLYPKWLKKEKGLGLANLDRTFTALDDTKLSSKADGRPKLLIFVSKVDESDNNASSVVKAISQSISSFNGVDIYVIDYDFNSKEDVSKYRDAYGCDEMKFAYDTTKGTRSIIIEYLKAAGQQYLWTTPPVICYIDENDILQLISQGQISVQTILDNLDIYCDYTSEGETPLPAGTYKITYILNGGTNSSENPATYTTDTETITLAAAVREGYIFEGWYKDANFMEQVTQIVKGSTGSIRLYAKWRAESASDDPDDPDDPNDQDDTGIYQVIFNVQGHGTAPQTLENIKAGSAIDSPVEPVADGYRFDGWYKDSACTKPWDFVTDTVQSNLTLYAKWLGISSDSEFAVQEIADLYYSGKAQKPEVSVYDENTLLKAGKDYTVKYYNNINANKNGVLKGEAYNAALPYVEITGKGNYKETVKINFNILRSSIGNDLRPAAGVTLKVNDQLVKANKDQKPFGSIKYGKNMKEGTDYELELLAVSVRDQNGTEINNTVTFTGAKIPANYTGEFMLTVTGTGNYTGSISRKIYVADKEHLMKNMKITLGKDLKNRSYTGSKIELKAAAKAKPANDEFVVTYGKKALIPGVDYDVSYNNNVGVGKAELVVKGKNGYVGSKTATFIIKGKTFTNGTVTVTGLQDQAYTGRAIIQNAGLTWKADGTRLVYGVDYTVSYSKNINKGTATITYTGKAKAGYSGKVSKKFKITAADISKVTRAQSMNAITLPYTKAGVKPVDEIILTNERGIRLSNGKDYTLAYKNNTAVANAAAGNAPTVTVKGKGNYSGSFEVKFTIERADLRGENITIECAQAAYDSKKAADYEYKPTVTIKDGKTKLKAGTDYEISYVRNKQSDYNNYLAKLQSKTATDADMPMAVITEKAGSAYSMQGSFEVPLEIYAEKLTKNNLEVKIDKAVYTGGQVRPRVTVNDGSLIEGRDYTLIYGANTASGKNKGSVIIKGLAPYYGGSVTYKFDITRKDLKYGFSPVIDEK